MPARLTAVVLTFVAALGAAQASAHGPAAGRPDEKELRTLEARTLGGAHAREHAGARLAARRMVARRRAMSPAARRREDRRRTLSLRAAASQPASEVGRWESPFSLPVHGIHAAMLPTGKVMLWSYPLMEPAQTARALEGRAWLWDPTVGTGAAAFEEVSPPAGDGTAHAMVFCSGGSLLADGRLLTTGGTLYWPSAERGGWAGTKEVWTFDPFSETWTRQPDMRQGRWYPSQELLPDGRTLILSGYDETGAQDVVEDLEVFTPSPDPKGVGTVTHHPSGDRHAAPYPHLFTMPSGQVLLAGPTSPDSALLTVGAAGGGATTDVFQWTDVPDAAWRRAGTAILEPAGPTGSTRVTQIGGVDPAREDPITHHVPPRLTSQSFDVARAGDDWELGQPMNVARSHLNAVVLPDASVVAVGGSNGESPAEGNYAAWPDARSRQVEIRDPATGAWRLGPAQQEDRAYHSTALLLPDGRVLSSGDDRPGTRGSDTGEVYSPPYLFRGPRPVVLGAPAALPWARPFRVESSGPAVTRAVLMAPGVVTHGAEMHAKRVELAVTGSDTGGVNLLAPPNANVAQPGWYMLFLMSDEGVPSVARWVRLDGNAPVPPAPPGDPASPGGSATDTPPSLPRPTPPTLPGFGASAGISIVSRLLSARGTTVTVRIANTNAFDVSARLTVAGRGSAARARSSMSTARIFGRRATTVRIRLSSQLAKLVRRRGRASATVSVTARDPNGARRTVRRSVVLLRR